MQRQSPFWENFCILLGRDGPGRVDVVPGDHADRDARALALLDRGWHLGPHWILARTTSTQNHFLSQLKTFDPKIVHFLPPQCQQCRRRSCQRSHCLRPSLRSLALSRSRSEPAEDLRIFGTGRCYTLVAYFQVNTITTTIASLPGSSLPWWAQSPCTPS